MIPAAFNITYYNSKDNIESFKTKSDSESDSESESDLLNITKDDIKDTDDINYVVKTKINKKKGNKLIGEGTFGCIYDDLNNPDKVHKIFLHSEILFQDLAPPFLQSQLR